MYKENELANEVWVVTITDVFLGVVQQLSSLVFNKRMFDGFQLHFCCWCSCNINVGRIFF